MGVWTNYVVPTTIYNLQILPETLMCGVIIMAILLASQPLIAVGIGIAVTQLLTHAMGLLIMWRAPDSATLRTSLDGCSMGFIGKSWARLFGASPDDLWHPNAPSIYLATIGFFAGWGYAIQQIYKDEIDRGIMKRPFLVTTAILSTLILLLAIAFRIYTGCESYLSAAGGTVIGLLFGFLGAITLSYITNRKATNIWGIPLLRKK